MKAMEQNTIRVTETMTTSTEDYLVSICEKRDVVAEKIKELTATKKAYEEAIKNTLKKPQKVTYGDWHISYAEVKTRRLDTKKVKAEYPAIAEKCMSETVSSRLTITGAKD
jgi:predicted phage-related endonuclease